MKDLTMKNFLKTMISVVVCTVVYVIQAINIQPKQDGTKG
jgi:hypothetical protein